MSCTKYAYDRTLEDFNRWIKDNPNSTVKEYKDICFKKELKKELGLPLC